jgi:hypothetical protein
MIFRINLIKKYFVLKNTVKNWDVGLIQGAWYLDNCGMNYIY